MCRCFVKTTQKHYRNKTNYKTPILKRNHIIVSGLNQQWDAEVTLMNDFSSDNDGNKNYEHPDMKVQNIKKWTTLNLCLNKIYLVI